MGTWTRPGRIPTRTTPGSWRTWTTSQAKSPASPCCFGRLATRGSPKSQRCRRRGPGARGERRDVRTGAPLVSGAPLAEEAVDWTKMLFGGGEHRPCGIRDGIHRTPDRRVLRVPGGPGTPVNAGGERELRLGRDPDDGDERGQDRDRGPGRLADVLVDRPVDDAAALEADADDASPRAVDIRRAARSPPRFSMGKPYRAPRQRREGHGLDLPARRRRDRLRHHLLDPPRGRGREGIHLRGTDAQHRG